MPSFTLNRGIVSELEHSAVLDEEMHRAAERIAQTAVSIAPVGDPSEPDPHPGQFKASIHAEGTRVVSDDPAAVYIIFGTSHSPPHDTLRRAAEMEGAHVMKEH